MTSRELLDLLNLKSGREGDPLREFNYADLTSAMTQLGLAFKTRVYRGFPLTCYLDGNDIRAIAWHFGVDLYPRRPA